MAKQDSQHMPEALTDLPAGGFGRQSFEAGGGIGAQRRWITIQGFVIFLTLNFNEREMTASNAIITVTPDNIREHPQAICFINPDNPLYHKKVEWYSEQYGNGMRIKLLYVTGEKRAVGFIEFTPGEHCWRAVEAKGYMFVHCIWTNGKKHQHKGLGGMLLREVEKEAEGMAGVAVVTSDSAFMASRELFVKNGYEKVSEKGKEQLMVKQFQKGPLPFFKSVTTGGVGHDGLVMIYSRQCPWVARFIEEVKPVMKEMKLNGSFIEIKTPEQAQNGPSSYGVFNLVYDGKVVADRYISTTRFVNIVKKEMMNR